MIEDSLSEISIQDNAIFKGKVLPENIESGILKVGGSTNVTKISIVNANNEEIGSIDENGVKIKNGNIQIENNKGKVILNSSGIHGLNITQSETKYLLSDQSIIGDNVFQQVNNLNFNNIIINNDTYVILIFRVEYTTGSGTSFLLARFVVNGIVYPSFQSNGNAGAFLIDNHGTNAVAHTICGNITQLVSLAHGKHSLSVEVARTSTDVSVNLEGLSTFAQRTQFSYFLLGN